MKNNQRFSLLITVSLILLLCGCTNKTERQLNYYKKAQKFYDEGNIEKASVEIKNALQIDGDFADGRYLHALIYEKDKNWQQVWANLNLVIELDPHHIKGLTKLSQIQLANGMYEKVESNANTILSLDENNLDAKLLLGSVFAKKDDFSNAINMANQVLAIEPGNIAAISILTHVYRSEDPKLALKIIGDGIEKASNDAMLRLMKIDLLVSNQQIETAVSEFRSVTEKYPENLFFHYKYIKLLQQYERIDEAEDHLRNLVNTKPDNYNLKLWLADFIATQRDLDKAEALLVGFLENQPEMVEIRKALGKVYTHRKKYKKALDTYNQILISHPKDAYGLEAKNSIVKIYLATGDRSKANDVLNEIFELEPENTEALTTLAKIQLDEGDTKTAISNLRIITRNQANANEAHFLLGKAYEQQNNLELALDNYRLILSSQPNNLSALQNASRLEIYFKNYDVAESMLMTLLKNDPGNKKATLSLISLLSSKKEWEEALRIADSLIEQPKSAPLGHFVKGRVFQLQEEDTLAIESFKASLLLQPKGIQPLTSVIKIYLSQNRIGDAKKYLQELLTNSPNNYHAKKLLGEVIYLESPKQAISYFEDVLSNIPHTEKNSSIPTIISLAGIYSGLGMHLEALNTYKKGVEINPNDPRMLLLSASEYQSLSMYSDAEITYKKVLQIEPKSAIAANNLINIYLDYLKTPENFDSALKLAHLIENKQHATFLDTLGWLNYHNGKYPTAIRYFEKALAEDQSQLETYFHLAHALSSIGRKSEAIQQIEFALTQTNDAATRKKFTALLDQLNKHG